MSEQYTLRMIFEGPYGQTIHEVAIGVGHCVGRDMERIKPPTELYAPVGFEEVAFRLKKKKLRKDLFMESAHRLGIKLAESMEDKEGWHGEERQERTD